MSGTGWKDVDPHKIQKKAAQQREDATTTGNVGAFPVPLGAGVQRPVAEKKRKKKE